MKAGKDSSLQAVSDSEAGEDFQPNGQTGAETTDHADALAANVVTDEDTETNNNTLTKSPSQSSNASAQVRDQLVTKSPIKTSSPSKETVSQQNDGEKLASPDRPSQAHPDSSPVKDVAEQPKTNGMPLFRPPSSDEQSKPNEMPLFHPASSDDNSSGSSSEADDLPLKQHPVTPKNRTPPSGVTARPSVSQSARPTLRSRPSTTHSLSDLLSMRRKSTAPAFPRPSISSSQVEKPSVISASQLVPSHLNDDESESESEDQNSSSEEEAPQDTVRRTRAKARATRLETQSQPIRNTRSAASRGRSPVKK